MQKIENYKHALKQLKKAVEAYLASPADELYRDGLIQRFEFTFELAWKSLKEYLEDQGLLMNIASPRGVLKEAFAAGIIHDEAAWNDALKARNLTSHVYDEETANQIANQICKQFLAVFNALADFYNGN